MSANANTDQDRLSAKRAKWRENYRAHRDEINERRRIKRQIRREVELADRELRDANSQIAAAWFSIGVFE